MYAVISIKDGKGKQYAYYKKINSDENIAKLIKDIPGCDILINAETKKNARCIVNHWNACYKTNGTYMFNELF